MGHDVSTVTQQGWTSLSNGALLRQAAATFDALLTADQNIEFQQNLSTLPLAVVVLAAESNRLGLNGQGAAAIDSLNGLDAEPANYSC